MISDWNQQKIKKFFFWSRERYVFFVKRPHFISNALHFYSLNNTIRFSNIVTIDYGRDREPVYHYDVHDKIPLLQKAAF